MTIDQARKLASNLLAAVDHAMLAGRDTIELGPVLQAADDAAREDLEAAIASRQSAG